MAGRPPAVPRQCTVLLLRARDLHRRERRIDGHVQREPLGPPGHRARRDACQPVRRTDADDPRANTARGVAPAGSGTSVAQNIGPTSTASSDGFRPPCPVSSTA